MEDDFNKAKEEIDEIYKDVKSIVDSNPELYIMPTELYNAISKKMGHLDDKLKRQTKSLEKHLSEKREMAKEIKRLKKLLPEEEELPSP